MSKRSEVGSCVEDMLADHLVSTACTTGTVRLFVVKKFSSDCGTVSIFGTGRGTCETNRTPLYVVADVRTINWLL
jgi:hypothetical protein